MTLKNGLNRDISLYTFEAREENLEDSLVLLHDFLISSNIPCEVTGIPEATNDNIPHRKIIEWNETATSAGMFIIYPGTEHEIVVGIFRVLGTYSKEFHAAIAYRQDAIFRQLMADLQAFRKKKLRHNGMIEVFSGNNMPLPDIGWEALILPDEIKQDITANIEGFVNGETVYRRLNIPYKRGFLFTGPPGNGKTMLLKVIASQYRDFKFLLFKKRSHSENGDIDRVFELAKTVAPCAVCFEDLDSLFKGEIMLSHFLNKIDGFEDADGLMILATTNHPEEIDPALTNRPSRFDRVWIFNNPDYVCRLQMLKRLFGRHVTNAFVESLAEQTNEFSMVYLKELYTSASLVAIRTGRNNPDEAAIQEALGLLRDEDHYVALGLY